MMIDRNAADMNTDGNTKDLPLEGQTAVVTGAGRGIGAAIARKLAAFGAHVFVCGRTQSHLDRTVQSIRAAAGSAEGLRCDVTTLGSVQEAARVVELQRQRCDILINNAGIGGFGGPVHQLAPDEWDRILATNLRGVYYCMHSFAPIMIRAKSGHIVNISSLNGLSYSAAEELREHGIRVSVVCPGSTNTELSPHVGKDPTRMLQPEDVAHAVGMVVTQAPQSFCSEILLRPTLRP
jgi:3-oxoacyl-[acyl-carrier protein] reductase